MSEVREIEFYECMSCKNRVKAKVYENFDQVKAGHVGRCQCSTSLFSSWNKIYKNPKASEIIKQSCCGHLLDDKDEVVEMVESLEYEIVLLKNQLKNATAEIKRLKNG